MEVFPRTTLTLRLELQQQYTNYKNNLQQLAQRIGEIEQDAEEHKYGSKPLSFSVASPTCSPLSPPIPFRDPSFPSFSLYPF